MVGRSPIYFKGEFKMSEEKKSKLKEASKKGLSDFKEFALKGNIVDMAVGVIIGGAFGTIVSSLVNDIIMPLISSVTGNIDFTNKFVVLGGSGDTYETLAAAQEAGANTLTFKALRETNPINLDYIRFEPAGAVPAHVHEFANEQDVAAKGDGYVGYKLGTCAADNAKQIKIAAMDGTFAAGSGNKTGNGAPLEGYLKIGGNNQSISYKFDWAGEAKTAKIYQYGYMDSFSGNTTRTYTSKQNGQTLGANGCNFGVNFNNQEVEITDEVKAITYGEFFEGATVSPGGSGNSNLAACIIGEVALANGDNTFTFTRYASYNLSISYFLIVIE